MERNILRDIVILGVGIGVGTTIGFLFAPKSGKETREEINNKIHSVKTKTSNSKKRKEFNKKIKEIEKDLKNLDK